MKRLNQIAVTSLAVFFATFVVAREDDSDDIKKSSPTNTLVETAEKCAQMWSNVDWEIDTARELIDEAKAHSELFLQDLQHNGASLGILISSGGDGIKVIEVFPDSGAERAGIRVGDVVQTIDNIDLMDDKLAAKTLKEYTSGLQPGDSTSLQIFRDGEPLRLDVGTTQMNWDFDFDVESKVIELLDHAQVIRDRVTQYGDGSRIGDVQIVHQPNVLTQMFFRDTAFTDVDADLGEYFGVAQGVLVTKASGKDDFKSGDIFNTFNGEQIKSASQAYSLISSSTENASASVIRNGIEVAIDIAPQESDESMHIIKKVIKIETEQ